MVRSLEDPAFLDLGEAASIDTAVTDLRLALDYQLPLADELARRLYDRLIAPLSLYLRDTTLLMIAPDGNLNLLSFALLRDATNRYLVQRYELAYLTSGRDLMRVGSVGTSPELPLVIGDPEFGHAEDKENSAMCAFKQLPGARVEARSIAGLLANAKLLLGEEATKEALLAVHAPRILHIATHGFFNRGSGRYCLPDRNTVLSERRDTILSGLLRSGLALAQSNLPGEPGILTALEAAGLDLHGTQLIVLSACEAGLGTVESGEGVLGLRRALAMAGVEAQLTSLWKTDDDATKILMEDYYNRLLNGAGRAEALRAAQLTMLQSGQWAEPRYWAPFIPVGAWTPLLGVQNKSSLAGKGSSGDK